MNLVGNEAICSKCHSLFLSRSKLHRHIKSDYVGEALPPASRHPSSSIPVIVSRAVHTSLGLGFGFKSWTYTTIAVTLASEHLPQSSDPETMACPETSCWVTLIDRHWLLKCLPGQKINIMFTSLKNRGIGASKYKSLEFITLFLYFLGRNNVGDLVYTLL